MGTAGAEEQQRVVRHLLTGCEECRAYIAAQLQSPYRSHRRAEAEAQLSGVVERSTERVLDLIDSPHSGDLVKELFQETLPRRELLALNKSRYRTVGVCEALIERALELRFVDARTARDAAKLALDIALRLDRPRLPELGAQARAIYGNALRLTGDLRSAEEQLSLALAEVEEADSPSLRAQVLSFVASLRFDQRLFAESVRLARQAAGIWADLGKRGEFALTLVQAGISEGERGRPNAAIRLLVEASSLAGENRRLALHITHNTIRFANDAGNGDLALALLAEARPLYDAVAEPLFYLKRDWLEGQILAAQGHLEAAAVRLGSTLGEFVRRENPFEAALVALELAEVASRLGRLDDVRRLASQSYRYLKAAKVDREALAATMLLRAADNAEAARLAIREVISVLRRPLPVRAARPLT
ncbi:MAG: hypothetical protein M3O15_09390 [Acidobacteriota bacterium]|nr:hypothetical protein [Acidobacteriota bacterium]